MPESDVALLVEPDEKADNSSAHTRQYVSFIAGNSSYAVDIMSVREIKGWTEVTNLPNQPDYVRGVLNLRGAVLPIIDLKCRLGEGLTEPTDRHVIVIVAIGARQVGLVADAVSDILNVTDDEVKPVPDSHGGVDTDVFKGFVTKTEQMVAMLDLSKVLNSSVVELNTAVPETNKIDADSRS